MILLPFTPNWASPLKDTRQFSTEILTSRSGREQRRALRSTPRRTIEFTFLAEADRLRALDRLMAVSLGQELHLADFTGGVRSVDAMPLGARSLRLGVVPAWVVPGATVALNAGREVRAVTVQSVSGATVTFVASTDIAWPVGSQVCPLLPGRLTNGLETANVTSGIRTGRLRFDVRPASSLPDDGSPSSAQLGGREILALRPNWQREPDITFDRQIEVLDYGRGRIAAFEPVPFTTRVTQSTFLARQGAEARDAALLFSRMRGRRGEFLAPTWTDDLALVLPASTGSTSLVIAGADARAYADDPVHRAIVIRLADGSLLPLAVTGIAALGQNTRFDLGAPLDRPLSAATVTGVSWLFQSRFSSDELVLEYVTDQVARFVLSTTTLPFQMPETLTP